MIPKTKHAHTNYKMIIPFINQVAEHERSFKFTASGYMDLVIEYLHYKDTYGNPVYSMTHYGEQNGDLMADPDMTFSVNRETETIIPYTYQNDYIGVYHQLLKRINGKLMYSQSMLTGMDDFLWHWLKNIEYQGFKPEVYK